MTLAELILVSSQQTPPIDKTVIKGAFCIPARSGRVWWPAALAVSDAELDRYVSETLARQYTFAEILVSGLPYANDYPEIAPDAGQLNRVLTRLKQAGLVTMVAFDDRRGPDLSYLQPVLAPNRDLIDWCMGIYEVNGVLKDPSLVLSVLKQSRQLLPDAILAVHFTPLDEGEQSYGLVDFHRAKDEANLQCLLFQTAGWRVGEAEAAARMADFTRRLGGPGMNGYPTLQYGVNFFEATTTKTYRGEWTEAQGVAFTNAVLAVPMAPDGGVMSVPATGFGDGGTV